LVYVKKNGVRVKLLTIGINIEVIVTRVGVELRKMWVKQFS